MKWKTLVTVLSVNAAVYSTMTEIFNFDKADDGIEAGATSSIANHLHASLTLCVSHVFRSNENGKFLKITDKGSNFSLTVSFYFEDKEMTMETSKIDIWLSHFELMEKLGSIGPLRLPSWHFSCIRLNKYTGHLDFKTNNISMATFRALRLVNIIYFSNFDISIGLIEGVKFHDKIGNINIFDDSVDFGSLNCLSVGTIQQWNDMVWVMSSGVSYRNFMEPISFDEMCNSSPTLLAVASKKNFGNSSFFLMNELL